MSGGRPPMIPRENLEAWLASKDADLRRLADAERLRLEKHRDYQRTYLQRPGVKEKKLARRRAYSQREDVKVRQRAYMKEYFQRDDVKEKRRAYLQREDVKERTKIKRIARAFAAAYGVSVDDLRGGSEP